MSTIRSIAATLLLVVVTIAAVSPIGSRGTADRGFLDGDPGEAAIVALFSGDSSAQAPTSPLIEAERERGGPACRRLAPAPLAGASAARALPRLHLLHCVLII